MVRQGTSGTKIAFTLKDAADVDIPLTAIVTLTFKLFDQMSGEVINSRNNINIKNSNGCVVVDGGGTMTLTAADNVMLSAAADRETHIALIQVEATGDVACSGERAFIVERVAGL
jgi:hypothetical protein